MATVKFKNMNVIIRAAKDLFKDVKTSQRLLAEINTFVVERIRFETRKGFSIPNNKKFAKLKDISVQLRKEAEALGQADPTYFRSADFANNTLTGQMLEALGGKIVNGTLVISVKATNRFGDEMENNAEVADNLHDLGRSFIGVNKKMTKRITKLVLDEYRRQLKNKL